MLNKIRVLFSSLDIERQQEVIEELEKASAPGFDFFLLVFMSCSIASFGLVTNSTAVIIGAMLIAPLMLPILGLSLASVAGESHMFRQALVALIEGALLAIVLSFFIGWVSHQLPFGALLELPSEVVSRTRPTPFDLGIAIAGGAAAAYALAQPHLSAALPGVAIATALMPPLCTLGICLAIGKPQMAFGALLLFLTNFVSISFAGISVFAALGFRPALGERRWHGLRRPMITSAALVLAVSIPLLVLTLSFVNEGQFSRDVQNAVKAEIEKLPDSQLVELHMDTSDATLHLFVTARASRQPNYVEVVAMQESIATQLQHPVALQLVVVPMIILDPLVPPTLTPTATPGPSLTPTITFTPTPSATLSPTVTRTPTITFTPTDTSTPTPTYTPTPVTAYISSPGGTGTYLRETPGGKIVIWLPQGTAVLILYQRETVNHRTWIEVMNVLNQIGWVPADYLIIRP